MEKTHESGFSTVQALLLAVIIGIIGFTGWFVWHSKQNTDKALNAAGQSATVGSKDGFVSCKKAAGSRLVTTYPEVCITKAGKRFSQLVKAASLKGVIDITSFGECASYGGTVQASFPRTCQIDSQTYTETTLTIKEWSVGVVLPIELKSVYYKVSATDPNTVYLSAKQISDLAPDCGPASTSLGAYFRQTAADHQAALANPTDTNPPASTKLGDYYYGYVHPQAECTTLPAAETLITEWQPARAFSDALKTIQTVDN